jgi:uncharacterized protein YukE
VLVILGAATAVALNRSGADESRSISDTTPATVDIAGAADRLVGQLEAALRTGDRAAFLQIWTADPRARSQARQLFHNLTALKARVDLSVALATAGHADVQVTWGLRGIDHRTATTSIVVDLSAAGSKVWVSGVRQAALTRRPIWMLGWLTVPRGPETVTAATTPATARQVQNLLEQANRDVRAVDRSWQGSLVAYVPSDQRGFDSMVEGYPGQYDHIAGVASSVDGSAADGSAQMIAINPAIFATLSAAGRRVLMTHEATHLATNATSSRAPDWLVEGFADYVAIRAAGVPAGLVAGPALGQLGEGLLRDLPSDADFSERDPDHQQQAYALSWLAVRMLAQRYGERHLISFYHAALASPERLDQLLRTHLSTSLDEVTRQWRRLLRGLADAD